jgi:hypothetical protein
MTTDKAGRKIALRRVGVVEQLRLYKALGGELSANDAYMEMAFIAASVSMIDDVPVPFPASEAALEAVLERLGRDGLAAVDAALPAPSEADVAHAAGNLRGTPG